MENGEANLTAGSLPSIDGIRVEQLCEILSREISRVREESMQQAHDMHITYEMELQALRSEFYSKQNVQMMQNELFDEQQEPQTIVTPQLTQTAD